MPLTSVLACNQHNTCHMRRRRKQSRPEGRRAAAGRARGRAAVGAGAVAGPRQPLAARRRAPVLGRRQEVDRRLSVRGGMQWHSWAPGKDPAAAAACRGQVPDACFVRGHAGGVAGSTSRLRGNAGLLAARYLLHQFVGQRVQQYIALEERRSGSGDSMYQAAAAATAERLPGGDANVSCVIDEVSECQLNTCYGMVAPQRAQA